MYNLALSDIYSHPWIKYVKQCFYESGYMYIFDTQGMYSDPNWFKNVYDQRLKDCFIQKWSSDKELNEECLLYHLFKTEFCLENYLLKTHLLPSTI